MAKESQILGIRLGIAVLSASLCAPVLCGAAGLLVGLAALLAFRLDDVPAPWGAAFEAAYVLLSCGAFGASAFVGWCAWKLTA
jgi:hypothetical protein